MTFHVPNTYRVRRGMFASTEDDGNNGAFFIPNVLGQVPLKIIASDGEGWEHVSVSLHHRTPTWEEMCKVKALFWDDEDVVMQLHPAKSQYVNNHRYCLHLWRPIGQDIPTPPQQLVGYPVLGDLTPKERA